MDEIIKEMETLILAETSEGKGYSQEILDAMRLDDVRYFETLGK